MHYTRIYADASGETHFEEVTVATELTMSAVSTAQAEVSQPVAVAELVFRRVIQDHPAEPHSAPRRQLIVQVSGETEIEVSDGEIRRFGPGSITLADDLIGKGHQTRRVGSAPRETLMISLTDQNGDQPHRYRGAAPGPGPETAPGPPPDKRSDANGT